MMMSYYELLFVHKTEWLDYVRTDTRVFFDKDPLFFSEFPRFLDTGEVYDKFSYVMKLGRSPQDDDITLVKTHGHAQHQCVFRHPYSMPSSIVIFFLHCILQAAHQLYRCIFKAITIGFEKLILFLKQFCLALYIIL